MKRTAIAVLLGSAALGLLISLALASRTLPVATHVAQYTATGDLGRVAEDFDALVAAFDAAWREARAPGEAARSLSARVAASPAQLPETLFDIPGGTAQRARVANSLETFRRAAADTSTLTGELLQDLTGYADDVAYVRDSGIRIVEQMRDRQLDRVAADTFQLVLGTLDFARPEATVRDFELRRLLVTLTRDQRVDANMPADAQRLRDAIERIVTSKPLIASKLGQLAGTPVPAAANALAASVQAAYQSAAQRIDRARLLLTGYAVVLLGAVAFVALRLHSSYRDINRANGELAELNQSLERRVAERTQDLESALANLKESQVQLVQAEKMSSLGQLVAGISHEINTPLLYLTNNAELLQERLGLLNEFVKRCLAAFAIKSENFADRADYQAQFVAALKEVKTMLRDREIEANALEAQDLNTDSIEGLGELSEMAQSLKDFSRLDRAPIASFDVNMGLDKTLTIAKNIIKHKAVVRKFYGEVPEIECSPSQINQVFLNIVTNAAQAIETTGEIVISTALHDAEHVAVRIADTGCGIPEEHLDKIRDPFFTTKPVGTGTGLGLSIVDEIIRGHGGRLLVESKVGEGSVFTIVLPIKRAAQNLHDHLADENRDPLLDDVCAEPLAEAV